MYRNCQFTAIHRWPQIEDAIRPVNPHVSVRRNSANKLFIEIPQLFLDVYIGSIIDIDNAGTWYDLEVMLEY